MSDSTTDTLGASSWRSLSGNKEPSFLSESICANCHTPFTRHIHKVVWLEISEHMARLKLTSTLRTALECKTRFTELIGNKISLSGPNQFSNTAEDMKRKNSGDMGRSEFSNPLGGSGGIGVGNTDGSKGAFQNSLSDANGIKANNNTNNNKISSPTASGYNGNNINLTNCNNNNITINITNSYTTNTLQNGVNFQQLTHCTNTPSTSSSGPMKSEQTLLGPSHLLAKNPVALSPAPPFPSFTRLSHPSLPSSFPQLPPLHQLKTPASSGASASASANANASANASSHTRSVHNGLESLAAVASILPREMLADYF